MGGITSGTVFYLDKMISVKPNRIASRTLDFSELTAGNTGAPEWVLYAMDQGETISSETSPESKLIYVLEGKLHMLVADEPCLLPQGASVSVKADTWHEFAAQSSCKFLQIKI